MEILDALAAEFRFEIVRAPDGRLAALVWGDVRLSRQELAHRLPRR